ncbi:MAG TPA: hypothetical protein VFU47_14600, partial [Armatimonadota bacterium]|nr:hypothetical protein [Armatimonadota bacterium]
MKLVHYQLSGAGERWGVVQEGQVHPIAADGPEPFLSRLLQRAGDAGSLAELLTGAAASASDIAFAELEAGRPGSAARLLAPLDEQEVWAAGVTYQRSKVARMEESEGAARFYDLVYDADRPELFFKATRSRVSGPGEPVRIRQDARWNVPEPELGLLLSPGLRILGYTVGNDMSSR